MRADASFADLMISLRHGDEEAVEVVLRHFAHRLIALADQHLLTLVRPKVDPEDVVQAAFRSFFRRQWKDLFDLDDWNNLWSLLALITVCKCAKKNVLFHKPGRDVLKERLIHTPVSPRMFGSRRHRQRALTRAHSPLKAQSRP